jgi:hypothetical protein
MEIASLIIIGTVAWFWFDSLRAREAGVKAVREACEEEGLQLLDETISLFSMKPARNDDGRMVLRRVYLFEFSDTGANRRRGSVHLLGQQVLIINTGLRLVANDRTLH